MTIYEFLNLYQTKKLTELSISGLYSFSGVIPNFSGQTSLTTVSIPDTVYCNNGMFSGCTKLVSVYAPKLSTIDTQAFVGCRSLVSVSFPAATYIGMSAFSGCYSLTDVLCENVSTVSASAFFNCTHLSRLELPGVIRFTGQSVFQGCTNFEELSLPNVEIIQNNNYALSLYVGTKFNHLYIPKCSICSLYDILRYSQMSDIFSVIEAPNIQQLSVAIGGNNDIFQNLSKIEHSKVEYLYLGMYGSYPALSLISLPNLKSWYGTYSGGGPGDTYFPSLTTIYLPNATNVSKLPWTDILESLVLPWSEMTYVGSSLIKGTCPVASTLTSLTLPKCFSLGWDFLGRNNSYLTTLNCNAVMMDMLSGYTALTSVSFPYLANTGSYAFYNCPNLTSVYMPNLAVIETSMFAGLSNDSGSAILDLDFPAVTKVNTQAFMNNRHLRCLSLYGCSTFVGTSVFSGCTNLMSLYLHGSSMVTLSGTATAVFANTPMVSSVEGVYGSVYVPSSLVATYQANGNWAVIGQRITAIPE